MLLEVSREEPAMADLEIALSCKNCSHSFTVLLMQMAEQNGKMVCPKCGVTSRYHFADLQKRAA